MICANSPTKTLSPKQRALLEELIRRKGSQEKPTAKRFEKYQTDPVSYSREILGVQPWAGVNAKGQLELFQDIGESVRKQLAGEQAIKIFRVEAGHGVGKTFGAACIANWFFDSFGPSITLTTAPTSDQVKLLLWKDIKSLRKGKGLPGRVLPDESKMIMADDWFAIGRTTSDSHNKGTERAQGQHGQYMLFVLDEAEGVPKFFFDAVNAMMTGGLVVILLLLANPKTRSSEFHKLGKQSGVQNYRLSVLDHPNVVYNRNVVPGATKRDWVIEMIAKHCDAVHVHDEDTHTFTVEYPVEKDGREMPAGTIWRPDPEFCFRVLGIAPANLADRVFVSPGRYEGALKREPDRSDSEWVTIGVDVARFGSDSGTIYCRHRNVAKRNAQIINGDTQTYFDQVVKAASDARNDGAIRLSVRVDGTGGFGSGLIDMLKSDVSLRRLFQEVRVHEVHFGASAYDSESYDDIVTEMYAEAAETLKGIRLEHVPAELETDLTDRKYDWVNRHGRSLRKLQEKEKFRKDQGRSPDDGDGLVLAIAPEHIFGDLYVHHEATEATVNLDHTHYEPLRDEFNSFEAPF